MIFNYLEFNFCYSVILLAESQFYHQPNGNALGYNIDVALGLNIDVHKYALQCQYIILPLKGYYFDDLHESQGVAIGLMIYCHSVA